jgi:microcystin-dependent protein
MAFDDALWLQGQAGVPSYSAREDRLVLQELWDEGVMDLTCHKVSQRSTGASFQVEVSVGRSVVKGDDTPNQGVYLVRQVSLETPTINPPPGGANVRYDLLSIAVNDSDATNTRLPTDKPVVLYSPGTAGPSTTAVPPDPPKTALPIAIIGPITNSTGSITNALIHDAHTGTYAGPQYLPVVRPVAGRRATPGEVVYYSGPLSAVPSGWLLGAAQDLNTGSQAAMFAHLGYRFGGSGSSFKNVDLRGRVIMSPDNMGGTAANRVVAATSLAGSGGAEGFVMSSAQMPLHSHVVNSHSHGGFTGYDVQDHAHSFAGTSGLENQTHTHSGLTDFAGNHHHIPENNTTGPGAGFVQAGSASGGSAGIALGGTAYALGNTADAGNHQHTFTSNGQNQNHNHNFSGTTAGRNALHQHTIPPESPGTSQAGGADTVSLLQPYLLLYGIVRT